MSAKSDATGKHTGWTRVALGLMLLTGMLSPVGSRAADADNTGNPGRATALSPTPLLSEELPGKAILLHFGASVRGGQVVVEWETAAETTAVGFYLYRQDPDAGTWVQVNEGIVPSFLGTATGGIYRVLDPEARPGGTLVYSLEEIRVRGQESRHGPFTVAVERTVASTLSTGLAAAGYEQVPHPADLPVRPAQPEPNRSTDVPQALPGTGISALSAQGDVVPRLWLPLVMGGGAPLSTPAITVSAPALAPFVTPMGSPSTAQSYTVTGSHLTAGLTISTPTGFELAVTESGPYSPTLTLLPSGGLVSSTVWVRLTGAATGAFSGSLVHESAGATGQTVAISGTVTGMAKLRVRADSLYYLAAEDIATVFGLSVNQVADLIAATGLKLTTGGLDVATLPAAGNAGLYFYGQGIDSIYTWDNVYWLEVGPGTLMGTVAETPPAAVPMATFTETVHAEENQSLVIGLFDDPEADYWTWDALVAQNATHGRKSFEIQSPGASQTGGTTLTPYLLGESSSGSGADHHAQFLLNGTLIGETTWVGAVPHEVTLSFDSTLLLDGANTVEVVALLDTGVPYSIFHVDSFDLSYRRNYEAAGNRLEFPSPNAAVATVYGFSVPSVMIFDISNPLRPARIVSNTVELFEGAYRVTLTPRATDVPYLGTTTTAVPRATTLVVDTPSALNGANAANYVIVTTAALSSSAGVLAAYRQAQGLLPMVIDIEDVYDEFNYGVASPHVLRDFLAYAYAHWSPAPHYVVLAGAGSYDYKDYRGYSDSLIPPILVNSINALAAADGRYADVVGDDGAPELVVGRLPVLTPAEFDAYVTKLEAYEAADPTGWSKQVLMLADNLDPAAGDFPADSAALADTLPAGYTALEVYLGPAPLLTATEAHSQTLAALRTGVGVFNYLGHGAPTFLAAEKLLTVTDVPNLQNSPLLPFMSAPTCTAGDYAVPGFRSLNMHLVLQADGGVAAAFSPTGESFNDHGVAVDTWLFEALFGGTLNRVGDATYTALAQFAAGGGARYVLDTYNFLGDPAMVMRWR